jgi:tRNA(fMet)-specific endonuclease VapC
MSFLLDTNIVSTHLRRPAGLSHRFNQHSGRLALPTLVLAELYAWAYGRDNPTPVLARIRALLGTVSPVDLMIASVALVNDLTLVTHNTRDFENIPGLRLQDWLTP